MSSKAQRRRNKAANRITNPSVNNEGGVIETRRMLGFISFVPDASPQARKQREAMEAAEGDADLAACLMKADEALQRLKAQNRAKREGVPVKLTRLPAGRWSQACSLSRGMKAPKQGREPLESRTPDSRY